MHGQRFIPASAPKARRRHEFFRPPHRQNVPFIKRDLSLFSGPSLEAPFHLRAGIGNIRQLFAQNASSSSCGAHLSYLSYKIPFRASRGRTAAASAHTPEPMMHMPAKVFTDILLFLLFLLLMAAPHTGSVVHERLGVLLAVVFLLHTCLNSAWYKSLRKGRYNFTRTVRLVLNVLLLLSMVGTLASAVPISRTIFAFTGFKGDLSIRTFHVFCAHWCFILAAVHFGSYAKRFRDSLQKLFSCARHRSCRLAFSGFGVIFAAYGIHAFLQRELIYPLTLRSAFMLWSENTALFLLDYSAVFFLCAWTASVFFSFVHRWNSLISVSDISRRNSRFKYNVRKTRSNA